MHKFLIAVGLILFAFSQQLMAKEASLAAIQPLPKYLAKLEECVATNNEDIASPCARIELLLDLTQDTWLNLFLTKQLSLVSPETTKLNKLNLDDLTAVITKQAETWLSEAVDEITEDLAGEYSLALDREYLTSLRFMQQRYNLATFKQFNYSYTGGAHGMHFTSYFVIDLLTQKQLFLADVLQEASLESLKTKLFAAYTQYDNELAQGWFASKEEALEALATENFFFNGQGLNFVYAPYTLAPYAYGEVTLTLPYPELIKITKPKYQLGIY